MSEKLNEYVGGLRMYSADGEEWCIAIDPADAAKVYEEAMGESLERQLGEPVEWYEEPPGKSFRYRNEDGTVTTKTCAAWVAVGGRGHFASSSY